MTRVSMSRPHRHTITGSLGPRPSFRVKTLPSLFDEAGALFL